MARALKAVALAAAFAALTASAQAHPHVEVETRLTVVTTRDGIDAVVVEWLFDPYYSKMLIADYRRARGGDFTEADLVRLKRDAFDRVAEFGYFVEIGWAGKPPAATKLVRDFSARILGDRVAYRFSVPVAKASARGFVSHVLDRTYFVDFVTPRGVEPAVTGPGAARIACRRDLGAAIETDWGDLRPIGVRCDPR